MIVQQMSTAQSLIERAKKTPPGHLRTALLERAFKLIINCRRLRILEEMGRRN